jgi:hypothetical protein
MIYEWVDKMDAFNIQRENLVVLVGQVLRLGSRLVVRVCPVLRGLLVRQVGHLVRVGLVVLAGGFHQTFRAEISFFSIKSQYFFNIYLSGATGCSWWSWWTRLAGLTTGARLARGLNQIMC